MMYHDGLFWHQACVQNGSRQRANAARIARSLNPALFVNAQSLSEMIRYAEAITPPIFFTPRTIFCNSSLTAEVSFVAASVFLPLI